MGPSRAASAGLLSVARRRLAGALIVAVSGLPGAPAERGNRKLADDAHLAGRPRAVPDSGLRRRLPGEDRTSRIRASRASVEGKEGRLVRLGGVRRWSCRLGRLTPPRCRKPEAAVDLKSKTYRFASGAWPRCPRWGSAPLGCHHRIDWAEWSRTTTCSTWYGMRSPTRGPWSLDGRACAGLSSYRGPARARSHVPALELFGTLTVAREHRSRRNQSGTRGS